MAVYLCHEYPDLYEHEATIIDAAPGRLVLDRSAFHPGGGGQVSDTGWLDHAAGTVDVTGVDNVDGVIWHVLADDALELAGPVVLRVDHERRSRVAQLHTDSHVLNALVYESFPGTLVTGAQINDDGTGRMDFDLSEVDNDVLRALDGGVNDVIRRGAGGAQRLRRRRRCNGGRRPRPEPVGRPAADARRNAAGDRHRRRRPPGLRWDPPREHRAVSAVPHHEGREQGQAQPPHPLHARLNLSMLD